MRPFAEGKASPWRVYVYEGNYWGRAIVTEHYKYITEYKPKLVEDFSPPGPNAEQLGLAQLFDRQAAPGETTNLAVNRAYSEIVKRCRDKLIAQECRCHRR